MPASLLIIFFGFSLGEDVYLFDFFQLAFKVFNQGILLAYLIFKLSSFLRLTRSLG